MHWNHRIVDTTDMNMGDPCFELMEVHYGDDGTFACTRLCTVGDSVAELEGHYKRMSEAFTTPVLTNKDFRQSAIATAMKWGIDPITEEALSRVILLLKGADGEEVE